MLNPAAHALIWAPVFIIAVLLGGCRQVVRRG